MKPYISKRNSLKAVITAPKKNFYTFDKTSFHNILNNYSLRKQRFLKRQEGFFNPFFKIPKKSWSTLIEDPFLLTKDSDLNHLPLFRDNIFKFIDEWFKPTYRFYGSGFFIHTGRDYSVRWNRFLTSIAFSSRFYRYLSRLTPLPGRSRKKIEPKKRNRLRKKKRSIIPNIKTPVRFILDGIYAEWEYFKNFSQERYYHNVKWKQRFDYKIWKRSLKSKEKYLVKQRQKRTRARK